MDWKNSASQGFPGLCVLLQKCKKGHDCKNEEITDVIGW